MSDDLKPKAPRWQTELEEAVSRSAEAAWQLRDGLWRVEDARRQEEEARRQEEEARRREEDRLIKARMEENARRFDEMMKERARAKAAAARMEQAQPLSAPTAAVSNNDRVESSTRMPAHNAPPRPAAPPTIERALSALEVLAKAVPQRIANEEVGDAIEMIHKMAKDQLPTWRIYLKVSRTFFWVGVHTVQHHVGWLLGTVMKIATGQGNSRK